MEKNVFFSSTSLSSAPKCFIYFCHLISFLSAHVSALHTLFQRGLRIALFTCIFLIHRNIFLFTTWQHFLMNVLCSWFFLYLPFLLVVFLEILNIKFQCIIQYVLDPFQIVIHLWMKWFLPTLTICRKCFWGGASLAEVFLEYSMCERSH